MQEGAGAGGVGGEGGVAGPGASSRATEESLRQELSAQVGWMLAPAVRSIHRFHTVRWTGELLAARSLPAGQPTL